VTGMICAEDPEGKRSHDAYHRFFRAARWSTNALSKALVPHMVAVLCPAGTVVLDLDDTLYKKSGRRIDGAGTFRDAVRSTRNKVVYATGLNLVIVTLGVCPPWGGMPIGVPVGVRLHRKGGPTTLDLAEEIICELAAWLSGRTSRCAAMERTRASRAEGCLGRVSPPGCAVTLLSTKRPRKRQASGAGRRRRASAFSHQ